MPLPDPALLPDDVAVLKQLIVQLLEQLRLRDERLQRQEHHIHLLLKRIYGSSSEKFDPQQGMLFENQADAEEAAANSPPPVARAASRTATSAAEGGFPTRPSVRKSFTIFPKPRRRHWAAWRIWSSCRRRPASNSIGGPRRCS